MPLEERWPILDWLGNTAGHATVNPAKPPASVTWGPYIAKRHGKTFKVPTPKPRRA